MPKAELKAG